MGSFSFPPLKEKNDVLIIVSCLFFFFFLFRVLVISASFSELISWKVAMQELIVCLKRPPLIAPLYSRTTVKVNGCFVGWLVQIWTA